MFSTCSKKYTHLEFGLVVLLTTRWLKNMKLIPQCLFIYNVLSEDKNNVLSYEFLKHKF